MLGAVWFLVYRLVHVSTQPNETLSGFLGLTGLAIAVIDRLLRRVVGRAEEYKIAP